jgi:hypothetical protein
MEDKITAAAGRNVKELSKPDFMSTSRKIVDINIKGVIDLFIKKEILNIFVSIQLLQ